MTSTVIEKAQIQKLCLFAGDGALPIMLAKNAVAEGVELTVFSFSKKNLSELRQITKNVFYYSPIEVFTMLDKLKELNLHYLTFIGKVPKLILFQNLHKIEKRLLDKVMELKNLNDDSLHLKIVDLLEKENNFKVVDQTLFLKDLFPGEKVFTERKPSLEEIEEAYYGLKMAKGIAALDIGQSVAVQNKSVIAVEAIEGTNNCIKRAAKIASCPWKFKGKDIFICKASKPNQDQRFDVPTVGINTVKTMPKNSLLVCEASEVFFPSQEETIRIANAKNICVFSLRLGN